MYNITTIIVYVPVSFKKVVNESLRSQDDGKIDEAR
jgi:hypothetical protein